MKRELRDELKKVYQAPKPERKCAFLHQIALQPIHTGHVVWSQISYISKLEWILSILLFGVTVTTNCFFETAVFGMTLALMPFLAVAAVSECMRSVVYGMDELEMAARFSLKSIILARMFIIGIENLVLVLIFSVFTQGGLLMTMLYLAVPYLITTYGSLSIVRKVSGKEGIYICISYSSAVSVAVSFGFLNYTWIYQEQFVYFWMSAVLLLIFANFKEGRRFLTVPKEEKWNYQ